MKMTAKEKKELKAMTLTASAKKTKKASKSASKTAKQKAEVSKSRDEEAVESDPEYEPKKSSKKKSSKKKSSKKKPKSKGTKRSAAAVDEAAKPKRRKNDGTDTPTLTAPKGQKAAKGNRSRRDVNPEKEDKAGGGEKPNPFMLPRKGFKLASDDEDLSRPGCCTCGKVDYLYC
jgi:hypothetical protein